MDFILEKVKNMNTILLLGIFLILFYKEIWPLIKNVKFENPYKSWKRKRENKKRDNAFMEFRRYKKWLFSYYNIKPRQELEDFQNQMLIDKARQIEKRHNVKILSDDF